MDTAKLIRADLKEKHGWCGIQVSVRTQTYSKGETVCVRIKDLNIPLRDVESLAKKYAVKDIIFIDVRYADEVLKPLIDKAQEIMPKDLGQSIIIGEYKVVCEEDGYYRFWKPYDANYNPNKCYGERFCAKRLVIDWLSQGGKV